MASSVVSTSVASSGGKTPIIEKKPLKSQDHKKSCEGLPDSFSKTKPSKTSSSHNTSLTITPPGSFSEIAAEISRDRLLEKDILDEFSKTFLRDMTEEQIKKAVKQFKDEGLLEERTRYGDTPIALALRHKKFSMAKELLEAGAELPLETRIFEKSIYEYILESKDEKILKLYHQKRFDSKQISVPVDLAGRTCLHLARKYDHKEAIAFWLNIMDPIQEIIWGIEAGKVGHSRFIQTSENFLKIDETQRIKDLFEASKGFLKVRQDFGYEFLTQGLCSVDECEFEKATWNRLLGECIRKKASNYLIKQIFAKGALNESALQWSLENADETITKKMVDYLLEIREEDDPITTVDLKKLNDLAKKHSWDITALLPLCLALRNRDEKGQTYYDFPDGRRIILIRDGGLSMHKGRKFLGKGLSSAVWRGLFIDADKKEIPVAVKKLKDTKCATNEFSTQSTLIHPHILRVFDVLNVNGKKFIKTLLITEEAIGAVGDDISKFKDNEIACMKFLRHVALGLEYLHTQKIMHRDIKPGNILIVRDEKSGEESYKIADFGFAKKIEEGGATDCLGTALYTPPEIAAHRKKRAKPYSKEVDIFSLGISLYQLFYNNFSEAAQTAQCRTADVLYPHGEPPDETLDSMIWQMTAEDPAKRPSLEEIIAYASAK